MSRNQYVEMTESFIHNLAFSICQLLKKNITNANVIWLANMLVCEHFCNCKLIKKRNSKYRGWNYI